MRAALLSFSFLIMTSTAALAQSLTPPPGPHPVGLHIVRQVDASRGPTPKVSMLENGKTPGPARPMQTLVWYPAQASDTAHVRYLDYLQSSITGDDFTISPAALASASKKWDKLPAAQASMLAVRDARAAPGSFPVVVYAPSFDAEAAENADLCEYLASHGYIVLASASRGAHSRGMTDDLEGVEAQAADIAWLAAYASTVPGADMSKLAYAGFSWGGLSNVFAASRSGRARALVSLDGSVRSYPQLLTASGSVTPANTVVPMLSIGSRPESIERLNEREKSTSISFLNKMVYADVYMGYMQPMQHRDFSGESIRMSPEINFMEYSRAEVQEAHSWTARYVRAFLDAYLKQDGAAMAFLKNTPRANGVPGHIMSWTARPASAAVPASKAAFVAEFKRRQFKDAGLIYDTMRKSTPDFKLAGGDLNDWGYELLGHKNTQGAIELFKLGTIVEPRWADVQDSLGEAYEAAGEPALALAAYERALVLNPNTPSSAARVKALRQPPPAK